MVLYLVVHSVCEEQLGCTVEQGRHEEDTVLLVVSQYKVPLDVALHLDVHFIFVHYHLTVT